MSVSLRVSVAFVALVAACGDEPVDSATCSVGVVLDATAVGECEAICGTIDRTGIGPLRVDLTLTDRSTGLQVGEAMALASDMDVVAFCWDGPLPLGDLLLYAEAGECVGEVEVSVSGFGVDLGLTRAEPLDAIAWTPEVEGLDDEPIFLPAESGWDSLSVMAPTVVDFQDREWLYYAGNEIEDFSIGVASRAQGEEAFERTAESPILKPGSDVAQDWKRFAQNTPEAVVVGDEVWVYYSGRREFDEGLGVGLAKSSDGLLFTDVEENPVLSELPEGSIFDQAGVAHPSIVHREGGFQLWYATGEHDIGYAVSEDGVSFERYCGNPVFEGSADTWDVGLVKAPEVAFDGDQYWMTYSGGGRGSYQVGWASSSDGVDWIAAETPILPVAEDGSWNAEATQEAFIVVEDATWTFWYAGNSGDQQQIGVVQAIRP
jgi:predicted GH43/DUF377 family glycosyl hydrolase